MLNHTYIGYTIHAYIACPVNAYLHAFIKCKIDAYISCYVHKYIRCYVHAYIMCQDNACIGCHRKTICIYIYILVFSIYMYVNGDAIILALSEATQPKDGACHLVFVNFPHREAN